jgi:hypothetical protein
MMIGLFLNNSSDPIRTDLADLTHVNVGDLPKRDRERLRPFFEALYAQVERPRLNIGGGGPPGRAD